MLTDAFMNAFADRALLAMQRKSALLNQSPLTERRAHPLYAARSVASDDSPHPYLSSSTPCGSAVEAGRPATPSTPTEECTCPVCTSDLAEIVPCEREEN